ncbi:MAG: hypothetical protein NT090_15005 [Acidobacteria bacterium]|nr:hypothetical protein [Acidobacteriota bacterium]
MDYCSEAGNNLIEEWYWAQDAHVRADFDSTLKTLSITEDWRGLKEFKMLGRAHPHLGEIRFRTRNVQYRPIGSFGPGRKIFAIWVGCQKKQNIYDPPNALALAGHRRRLFLNERKGSLHEHIV